MKKLLITTLLVLSACFASFASYYPLIYSGCIQMAEGGDETLTIVVNDLTPGYTTGYLWIYISGDPSDSHSYLPLSSLHTPMSTTDEFTYTIHAASAIPLNQCYTIYFGSLPSFSLGGVTPPFTLCPCVANGCYYQDPTSGHFEMKLVSSAPGPLPLYVWVDPGGGAEYIGTSPTGTPDGTSFDHTIDITASGALGLPYPSDPAHTCFTVTVSDVWTTDLTSGSNWNYSMLVCQCHPSLFAHECYNTDPAGYEAYINAETDFGGTSFTWYETSPTPGNMISIAPNPSYPGVPGELPYNVVYDITAAVGAGGISPGSHNVYFTTTSVDPRPSATPVVISSCDGEKHGNTQVASMPKAGSLTIMPNPNSGSFAISGSVQGSATSKQATIEVIDMLGKTIYTDVAPINNNAVNKTITLGDNLANGIYLVRVKNDNVNQVIRFTLDR